jgi:NTE family protein
MLKFKYKIGLVLSGGGARGFAHLGVIQALNEYGIFPDVICGTSAGAIAGVLYADGYSPKEILKITNSNSRLNFVRPTVPRDGLLQIAGVIRILKNNLHAKTFEELKIPLFVTATDLNNGRVDYFSSGDLINPVIASASIPVLFKPVVIDNKHYVDGGVLDNLPIKPIENKCRFIIGSFVNPTGYQENVTNLINIAERSFLLSMSKEVTEKAKKFNLFIAPLELCNYKILDPDKADELFMIGFNATIKKLNHLDVKSILGKELNKI